MTIIHILPSQDSECTLASHLQCSNLRPAVSMRRGRATCQNGDYGVTPTPLTHMRNGRGKPRTHRPRFGGMSEVWPYHSLHTNGRIILTVTSPAPQPDFVCMSPGMCLQPSLLTFLHLPDSFNATQYGTVQSVAPASTTCRFSCPGHLVACVNKLSTGIEV